MNIRESIPNDNPALAELMSDLGYPTSSSEMETRMMNINNHADYATFVAEVDGLIVGMIGLIKGIYYEKNGAYLRIVVLVTKTGYRGGGIGQALLTRAEKFAVEENITTILVNSGNRPERADAYTFYQKMGYEIKSSGFVKTL